MEFSLSTQFRVVLFALWWTAGTPKKFQFRELLGLSRPAGRRATAVSAAARAQGNRHARAVCGDSVRIQVCMRALMQTTFEKF